MNCGAVPKRSAMYGTSGIRMPNPSVSMTQKRNSAASCRRTLAHSLRFMGGDERRDVHAGWGGRQVVARPANDQVGDAGVVPVGIAPRGRGAQYRDLQRGQEPQAIATLALHREQVVRGVRLAAGRGTGSEPQGGAVLGGAPGGGGHG